MTTTTMTTTQQLAIVGRLADKRLTDEQARDALAQAGIDPAALVTALLDRPEWTISTLEPTEIGSCALVASDGRRCVGTLVNAGDIEHDDSGWWVSAAGHVIPLTREQARMICHSAAAYFKIQNHEDHNG